MGPTATRVVVLVSLLELAALGLHAQSAAGSIVAHSIVTTGNRVVIDYQQNVYSYSIGGGCGAEFGVPIGCQPMEIIKADATGAVVFQTTLAAPGSGSSGGFTVDSAGEVYFVGVSQGQLPTSPNAALPAPSTGGGPFAAKLSADGSTYLYLTYLPSALAAPSAIQLDAQGNAYIAGIDANSQPFVTALNPDGSAILYTTVLAAAETIGSEPSLAVDAAGNAVIGGNTGSDFPVTSGVLQPLPAGSQNAFLTKLDNVGNIVFSTYLGQTGDAYGRALVALETAGLPVSDEAYQKGVKYLLSTQQEDGSWFVRSRAMALQPYFDSGFPHGFDQWISAAGTNWATIALSLAAPAHTATVANGQ
jgi:hypothetical protein